MQVQLHRGHRDLREALEREAADIRQALQTVVGNKQTIFGTTNPDAVSLQTVCSVSSFEDFPTRLI